MSLTMKKIITTLIAASMMLAGTSAFAQISVGVGYLGSPEKLSATNMDLSKSFYMNGLYAGIDNTFQFDQNMGMSVGVYYVYSAASAASMFETLELVKGVVKGTLNEHFINIPFNLKFGADIQEGLRAFFFVGPTVSCGLSSKVRVNAFDIIKGDISDNYKHDYFERFDLLFGAGAGLDIADHFRLKAGYDFGLFNRVGEGLTIKDRQGNVKVAASEKATLNRSQFTFGLAYIF